jgi:hypothetical protein
VRDRRILRTMYIPPVPFAAIGRLFGVSKVTIRCQITAHMMYCVIDMAVLRNQIPQGIRRNIHLFTEECEEEFSPKSKALFFFRN